jgi:Ser/Thr protein kinase RdoA (MazF antagonist)
MESQVRQLFNTEILKEAACLFAADADSAVLLSNVENFVYACSSKREPIILRITHRSHREVPTIQGELEWMAHLFAGGVPLAMPLRSIHGNMVEQIGSGEAQFAVTAFPKLPGQPILDAGECTPEIYRQWGRVMGRIHALSKTYQPSDPSYRRGSWFENDILINAEKYIPGQAVILGKLQRLMDNQKTLPQDRESYGLIHRDFTDVNFFVHDHHIAVFDFDDSEYHWFIYDIAIVLFDAVPFMPHLDMNEINFGKFFWQHFYAGYLEENILENAWIERLPQFMKLYQMYMYIWTHMKKDAKDLKDGEQRWLAEVRERIENDVPCLKFDPRLNQ